jgi:hypothetical protein
MQQKRISEIKFLRKQIQAKLAEKRLKKEKSIPPTPPRYDDVFFEGVKWLDNLAVEPFRSEDSK